MPIGIYQRTEEHKRRLSISHIGKRHTEETKKKLKELHKSKKLSEEHKRKIGLANKGKKKKPMSQVTKDKIRRINLGRKLSEETKKKISNSNKGRISLLKGKHHSEETKKKMSEIHKKIKNKGRFQKGHQPKKEWRESWRKKLTGTHFHTTESRKRIGEWNRGNKSRFWRGGITPINSKIRHSMEYKLWRESVFKRDNWTCKFCGQLGNRLHADHIKPFSLFPELRFAIDNGRTLCKNCHKKTDTYGKKILYWTSSQENKSLMKEK